MQRIAERAKSIFFAAIEMPTANEQTRYIQDACGDDCELRDRVQKLLAAHVAMGSINEQPPSSAMAGPEEPIQERVGNTVGRYKLLEQIGEGGMGVVFVAEQTEPVRRRVAVKIIKPGMDTKQVIARFEAERQALAMMEHPNIARVLDAGATELGRPYFVMELVRGMPITDYCDKAKLDPRKRLELFVAVCQAVQHAHQKGIIHRDLKPPNILVTLHDGVPVVKVIDFGVAKAVSQQLTERTLYTALTQLVGTPLYMSPEQAEMSGLDVDTRSDVYSLGVLLYELLTGQTPFDKETLGKAGLDEIRRVIREHEPLCPSRRLSTLGAAAISTLSQHRSLDERKLSQVLRGELDWIVMKSLEKDRERRYESASSFARDIERYLADEPVQAGPPSAVYRFSKYAYRNRAVLTATGLVGVLLVVAAAVSTWQAIRATAAETKSKANENRAIAGEQRARQEERKALAAAAAEKAARDSELSERQRAEKGEAKAQQNFESALDSVDRLLAHVGSDELFEIPHVQPVRRKILDDALRFYEQFRTDSNNSPAVRNRLARTWTRKAILLAELGDRKAAQDAHERALAIIDTLVLEHPDQLDYLCTLADSSVEAGWYFGKVTIGGVLYRRAIEIYQRLIEADYEPTHSTSLCYGPLVNRQVTAMTCLANEIKPNSETVKQLDAALIVAEQAGEKAMRARVDALVRRITWDSANSQEERERGAKLALSLLQEWIAKNDAGKGRIHQNTLCMLLETAAQYSADPKEAEKLYRQALETRREFAAKFPSNVQYQTNLLVALQKQMELLRIQASQIAAGNDSSTADKQLAEADSLFDELIAVQNRAVTNDSADSYFRAALVGGLYSQARHLRALAKSSPSDVAAKQRAKSDELVDEAAEFARMLELKPTPPNVWSDYVSLLRTMAGELRQRAPRNIAESDPQALHRLHKADELVHWALETWREVAKSEQRHYWPDRGYRLALTRFLSSEAEYLLNESSRMALNDTKRASTLEFQADALLTEAIQLCHTLIDEFPDDVTYKDRHAELQKLQAYHPTALASLKQRAESLEKAGSFIEAELVWRELYAESNRQLGADHWQTRGVLNRIGVMLREQKKFAEAEPVLRQVHAENERCAPDAWTTFYFQNCLGDFALRNAIELKGNNPDAAQEKFAEAESLMLKGYEGMKARAGQIPADAKKRLPEAIGRLVQLYKAWDKPTEAVKWQAELKALVEEQSRSKP